MSRRRRLLGGLAIALVCLPAVAEAHGASIRASRQAVSVPTWLFLGTGGAVVGASFLLASLVTERAFVRTVHAARRRLAVPERGLRVVGAVAGLVGLAVLVVGGLGGPSAPPLRNAAIVVVWVGWWPGFTMTTYLVGNAWPAVNPARTLARLVPGGRLSYPRRLGAWPATVGVLAVIYLEVVSPLATEPTLLVAVVVGYLVGSTAGGVVLGADWWRLVDPVARAFRTYGSMAPVGREDGRLCLRPPGAGLVAGVGDVPGAPAFVVALLWGTTYDGMVATPAFADVAVPVVEAGVPPLGLYLAVLVGGFLAFLAAFRGALRAARRLGPTYRRTDWLAARFAASLVPIAAGYHLAHYLGDLLSLWPTLTATLAAPLDPPVPVSFVLPEGFGLVPVAAVLLGHLVAIAVAHAAAFDAFPGRLQAVRSQAALTVVMVAYTVVSLWIVTRPTVVPPYL